MARMFPPVVAPSVRSDPGAQAEVLFFTALAEALPDDYRVFHRVAWLARRREGRPCDGETDFVILHPDHGLLCVEVKGGEIRRDGTTGEWRSRDRRGGTHRIKDPVSQAREARYLLQARLASLPGGMGRPPGTGHAVAFPEADRLEGPLPPDLPAEILILEGDLPFLAARIEAVFRYWIAAPADATGAGSDAGTPPPRLSPGALANLEQVLSPTFEIRRSLRAGLRMDDREILRLTDEQTTVLDLLARIRRVDVGGGAGTGKTCLALEKARRLAAEGFRTLLTCFNRPLAEYLEREAGFTGPLTVSHFHRLCHDMAVEAGVPVAGPEGPTPPPGYFEEQLPAALAAALTCRPDLRFDAILVDEAQDFAPAWWPVLLSALEDPEAGILYVFHDGNQRIYRAHHIFPRGLVPVVLTRNLRNTRAIHRLARGFYDGDKFEAAGPEGRPVEFIEARPGVPAEDALNGVLHRLIDAEGVPLGDLAVLSGHRRLRSEIGRDGLLGDYLCTETPATEPGRVLFQTVHRFKGLERPVIVLIEMEDRLDSEELFYVSLSRARGHLVVIGTPEVLARIQGAAASAPDAGRSGGS